ncbi:hypothetical protein GD597_00475 [Panacibacter sp. KCS-6]|uniref:Uncharacterized protein n=1 Tax=Limnovirga soli TaxID=2656915 RepID=A0A8J8F9C7_9BACT|nr:hypothetical protein [Limnovirga soli]
MSLFFALGIAAESPQRSEDLQRKARPAGQRPNCFLVFVQQCRKHSISMLGIAAKYLLLN